MFEKLRSYESWWLTFLLDHRYATYGCAPPGAAAGSKTYIEILTVNLGFLTMASLRKVSSNDCDNDGQPEMAMYMYTPKTAI